MPTKVIKRKFSFVRIHNHFSWIIQWSKRYFGDRHLMFLSFNILWFRFFYSRILCVPGLFFFKSFQFKFDRSCDFYLQIQYGLWTLGGSLNSGQFTYIKIPLFSFVLHRNSRKTTHQKYFPKCTRIHSQISINFVLLTFYTIFSDTSVIVSSAFSFFLLHFIIFKPNSILASNNICTSISYSLEAKTKRRLNGNHWTNTSLQIFWMGFRLVNAYWNRRRPFSSYTYPRTQAEKKIRKNDIFQVFIALHQLPRKMCWT